MKSILLVLLLLSGFSNAWAKCLDSKLLSRETNFDNCVIKAGQGDVDAQSYVGNAYYIQGQYKQAMLWLQKAAEQGNIYALVEIGAMYQQGQGVAKNYAQAAAWYQKAAKRGNVRGQYRLGEMYEEGRGVTQNYAQAVAWYQKSAGQGWKIAQYRLGFMYGDGRGVTQNYVLAHMWWNIAGAAGYRYAIDERDGIAKKMTSVQIQKAQGLASEWVAKRQ